MSAFRAEYTGRWSLLTQTFRACFVLLLVGCGWTVTACSSDEPSDPVYENWTARNAAAFSDTMRVARTAIAQAKAQYGDAWTEHTPWRVFGNYTLGTGGKPTANDSLVSTLR